MNMKNVVVSFGRLLFIMKGTKVLTLGAGREVLPHNMAVTKMYMRMTYIHAL